MNILDEIYIDHPEMYAKDLRRMEDPDAYPGDLDAIEALPSLYKRSKRFYLDVRTVQNLYTVEFLAGENLKTSETSQKIPHLIRNYNPPPFDETSIVFDNPLEIRWAAGHKARGEDASKPYNLLGVCVEKRPTKEKYAEVCWRVWIFLLEDSSQERFSDVPKDIPYIVGCQYADFLISSESVPSTKGEPMKMVIHGSHLCRDEFHCVASGNKDSDKTIFCQEYENSRALFNTVFDVFIRLNEKKQVEYKDAPDRMNFPRLKEKDASEWSGVQTQGAIPSPFYEVVLPEKAYRYEEKREGPSGIEHRFRYDVRRHPRIVNNRILWIEPHRRGKGEYIPKVYKVRGVISVDYAWRKVEGLTRYRFIERILIWSIRVYRRFKNY